MTLTGWRQMVRRPVQLSPAQQIGRGVTVSIALLMGWLLFYAFLLTPLQAHHYQGVLYSKFRQQVAEETAPLGGQINPGQPVAVLDIPGIGVKREVVIEGTASGDLEKGPGHLRSTVLPGQAGLSVIMGRAQLFGAPFGSLPSVKLGSLITVTTGEGTAKYSVTDVRHAGDPNPQPIPTGGGRLLLVTAQSAGWRSGWAPSGTVYVDAALTSKPFGGVSGAPSVVPKTELPMTGDIGALYTLVLWLPLLLGAVLGVLWSVDKWGRWQAWLVGAPVLLATLWGVSQTAVQLLPNLL